MTLFTQSPIEAALWTSFVAMQEWVTENILLTPVFKGAVFTWLGILFIQTVWLAAGRGSTSRAVQQFMVWLCLSCIGFSILNYRSVEPFQAANAQGRAWTTSARVRASDKYGALNAPSAHGLALYVQIHRGAARIASFISQKAGEMFKNSASQASPYLLLQTLAQTAGQTIDDPQAMSSLQWLFENCADGRTAPVLSATSSYSALFDLSRPDCRDRHQQLRGELKAWANGKWGTSWWNVGQIGLAQLQAKFGLIDEEVLQNKMIASALVNTARRELGRDNRHNVNSGALLAPAGTEPSMGPATTYFTALANTLSVGGATSALLSPFIGSDYWGADARNQSAYLYNRIVQFLPPIRGYAKGLLAFAFVFAAASLCFGTVRFMMGWLGMLMVFTLYEPLSTLLYESVMLFSNAKESVDALQALRNDPLILSGAAIVDDNLARIQAVYFALQIGLATLCAAGGISLFMFTKRLGGGLMDGVAHKAVSFFHTVTSIRGAATRGGASQS